MKNFHLILFNIFITILLGGCGSGGDSMVSLKTGFSVTSISPSPDSTIRINQMFTFGFNSNVDFSTIKYISLINTTSGKSEKINCYESNATTIQCTPNKLLSAGTTYNINLPATIKDQAQNSLNPRTISYTTFNQPIVISADPESGNIGLKTTTYTYVFSESMDNITLDSMQTPNNVTFTDETTESAIPIKCNGQDNTIMVCKVQASLLILDHTYMLGLSQKIKALDGIALTPTSYSYAATNYTQPRIESASPESGSIGLQSKTYTYTFNELMDTTTLNSSQTPGNVIFTDTTLDINLPIKCNGQDSKTMVCNLLTQTLSIDHEYMLNVTSKIHSQDNVSLAPTAYTYRLESYSYNWDIIYNLPETTAESIYNIQYVNNVVYACAVSNNNVYLIQYINGMINNKSTNIKGQCKTYSNDNFYISGNSSPNMTFSKYNINRNTLTKIDSGNGIWMINDATENNGIVFYLVNPVQGFPEYLKIYDGTNISNITLPKEYPLYVRYYNGDIIVTTLQGIYSSHNGVVSNITYGLPKGGLPLVDGKNLYMSYDYPSVLLYKLNNNSWQQIYNTQNIYPYQIKTQSIYGFTPDHKVVKYSLIGGITKNITPSMLSNEKIDSLTVDDDGNVYLATSQKIYKGVLQ